MRQEGDYDDFINFELKYVEGKLEQAKDFVERVTQLINL